MKFRSTVEAGIKASVAPLLEFVAERRILPLGSVAEAVAAVSEKNVQKKLGS